MCNVQASSTIAAKLRLHGKHKGNIKQSWADDSAAWARFLDSIDAAPLRRLHVMGGEPMLMKRYHQLIDHLIAKERFEISLSFVTNGTIIDQELINKLKLFVNVDIEISIESLQHNNDYIRQGSSIDQLRANIELVAANQDDKLQLVLRTVPQLLSIKTYAELIRYAYDNQLIIEGIPLIRPEFMAIRVLPKSMRLDIVPAFQTLRDEISKGIVLQQIQNGRNRVSYREKLMRECDAMIRMLDEPEPDNVSILRKQLADHLFFWDKIYQFDIDRYYPELMPMLESHGYGV